MIAPMRRFAGQVTCFVAALLGSPLLALAQDDEDLKNARLEGYANPVTLEPQSSALTYLLFFFLATIAAAVLFKNAKRSHLD
jgi:hypothetical protein